MPVECGICWDNSDRWKILPCSHVFCEDCVDNVGRNPITSRCATCDARFSPWDAKRVFLPVEHGPARQSEVERLLAEAIRERNVLRQESASLRQQLRTQNDDSMSPWIRTGQILYKLMRLLLPFIYSALQFLLSGLAALVVLLLTGEDRLVVQQAIRGNPRSQRQPTALPSGFNMPGGGIFGPPLAATDFPRPTHHPPRPAFDFRARTIFDDPPIHGGMFGPNIHMPTPGGYLGQQRQLPLSPVAFPNLPCRDQSVHSWRVVSSVGFLRQYACSNCRTTTAEREVNSIWQSVW